MSCFLILWYQNHFVSENYIFALQTTVLLICDYIRQMKDNKQLILPFTFKGPLAKFVPDGFNPSFNTCLNQVDTDYTCYSSPPLIRTLYCKLINFWEGFILQFFFMTVLKSQK